ncbi:hypothetical protein AMTR_s00098p00091140 [Amborella trichopoda]|uniref:Uncharacterized protein n=1 Tax=Amborella trichopoda TaxID=13333 RepID=W1NYR9_AMBTC|nr:hypothetical protein AMTR_s00098p00091140 [Amborella trichopoda]
MYAELLKGQCRGGGDLKSLGLGIGTSLGGGERQNRGPAYLSTIVGSRSSLEKAVSTTSITTQT